MIPACKLWEKVSAKGNRYLVGHLGGVRVLVMEPVTIRGQIRWSVFS